MSRPLRLDHSGALWHLTTRGNAQGNIFDDEDDRTRFVKDLARVVHQRRWTLHAYVLMDNHYHLLVETTEANLSDGMRDLNGRYAQGYNRRHHRVGHLFQGRFKGILVEREAHLLQLTRYIVLNPLAAREVTDPTKWEWSSYQATAGLADAPTWLEVGWTRRQFHPDPVTGALRFQAFVQEGAPCRPLDRVSGGIYLGGPDFLARMQDLVNSKKRSPENPLEQRMPNRPESEALSAAVLRVFSSETDALRRHEISDARLAFAVLARDEAALRLAEIGSFIAVGRSRASALAVQGEERLATDPVFAARCAHVLELAQREPRRGRASPSLGMGLPPP